MIVQARLLSVGVKRENEEECGKFYQGSGGSILSVALCIVAAVYEARLYQDRRCKVSAFPECDYFVLYAVGYIADSMVHKWRWKKEI